MDWYEPVDVWDIYGINNREDFVKQFVVEGKFHKNVPEDVVNSFETVSYLLAHSYYHLPMFDEAMSKALLIMEMAIKQKASALGIPLEKKTKNNRIIKRRLVDIIDDVFRNEYLKFLKPDFDRARNFRNVKMHPERHGFMGAIGLPDANVRLFNNVINMLFMGEEQLIKMQTETKQLELILESFKRGLFVLQFEGKKILIDGFFTFKYRVFEKNKLLLLYVKPLTTKVHEQFIEKKYPEPLILILTDFEIKEGSVEGVDLQDNPIGIFKNDKRQNLKTYHDYELSMSKVSESDISMFSSYSSGKALWHMEKVIYEHCWVTNQLLIKN